MTVSKKQGNHIQILRGLAIVAVVLIHTAPVGLTQVFVRPFLNFAVGLFLFLSGLLSDAKNWHPGKRIKKVIIPYVLWTLIYCILNGRANPAGIPVRFLVNLFTGDAAAMLYYIFLYCEFALLIPLFDKLAKSKFWALGLFVAPLELIFIRTLPVVTGWYTVSPVIAWIKSLSCLGWVTYFYLGYLIGNRYISFKKSPKLWGSLLAACILLQFAEGYWLYTLGMVNCGTQTKLTTLFTNVCFMMLAYQFIMSEKEYKSKILKHLGDDSFGIYFSHIAVMGVLSLFPFYDRFFVYPLNAAVVIVLNVFLVFLGRKILGKYSKYLGL